MFRRPYRRSAAPRGGFRRRRFGPRLRIAKEPQRWEVGHFFFGNIINITDTGTPNATIVTSFAQIPGHFGDNTAQGRTLDNAARWLEIGGVVFRYEVLFNANFPGGMEDQDAELQDLVTWRVLLCSDRLDSVGQPTSIPNWFNNTTPIIAAGANAAEDLDNVYPTRIHWQNFHTTSATLRAGSSTSAVGLQSTKVDSRRGSGNLRLRLRLDDQHGLFWHFAQAHSSPSDSENVYVGSLLLTGTVYYRFRIG